MRSDLIKEGVEKTPHRAILKALGVTDSEMHRPFIAVVCAASDYVPGHMHLHEISKAVKDGIRNAGGVPFEFFTIGVCDGLAMNHKGMRYSLASRELIADSTLIGIILTSHLQSISLFLIVNILLINSFSTNSTDKRTCNITCITHFFNLQN